MNIFTILRTSDLRFRSFLSELLFENNCQICPETILCMLLSWHLCSISGALHLWDLIFRSTLCDHLLHVLFHVLHLDTYGMYYLTKLNFILQQNTVEIKVENDACGLSEENSIAIKTDEVCLPSCAFVKTEPEVRLVFVCHLCSFLCVCLCYKSCII